MKVLHAPVIAWVKLDQVVGAAFGKTGHTECQTVPRVMKSTYFSALLSIFVCSLSNFLSTVYHLNVGQSLCGLSKVFLIPSYSQSLK